MLHCNHLTHLYICLYFSTNKHCEVILIKVIMNQIVFLHTYSCFTREWTSHCMDGSQYQTLGCQPPHPRQHICTPGELFSHDPAQHQGCRCHPHMSYTSMTTIATGQTAAAASLTLVVLVVLASRQQKNPSRSAVVFLHRHHQVHHG